MTNPISDSLPSWAARITDDQGEMVDRTPLNGSNGRTRTFEVQVELPSGPYNDYVYDAKRRAFRLQAVVSPEHSLPADCGALVGTMGSDGRPLAALLLVSGPTVPGCLVDARVLGGVELASGETRIVAVPDADPAFEGVSRYQDLGAEQLPAIERLAADVGDGSLLSAGNPRWLDPEEAVEVVREALRAARLATAANRKVSGTPAWQVVDPALRANRDGGATQTHSEAEFSVRDIPARFQEHVADCLQPDERILHFIHRPRMALDSRFSLLRRRELNEGLLVVTDRQVLLMSDALSPDVTLVDWGYLAAAAPVERLRGVWLDETGATLRLDVDVSAGREVETLSMEFARSSLEACRYSASILRRFVPEAGTRAVRRLYEVKAVEVDLSEAAQWIGPETIERLEAVLARTVQKDEEVLARALAPASSDRKHGPRLLAITHGGVVLMEDRGGRAAVATSLNVEDIGSAELRYSILGSRLRLTAHGSGGREQLILDSENPGVFGPMLRTFRLLLPLLANPISSGKNHDVP